MKLLANKNLFELQSTERSVLRRGLIKGILQTPTYITHTKLGSLPNISDFHCDSIYPSIIGINFPDFAFIIETLKQFLAYNNGNKKQLLKKYIGRENKSNELIYLSFGDYNEGKVFGTSKLDFLEIKCQSKKGKMTAKEYIEFVNISQPDLFVTPSEMVKGDMGRKRRKRAVKQSISMLNECLLYKEEMNINIPLIVPIITEEHHYEHFLNCIEISQMAGIQGYLIMGINDKPIKEKTEILRKIWADLVVQDNLRILNGDGEPLSVLYSIAHGFDLFESNYPFQLGELNFALNLEFTKFNIKHIKQEESKLFEKAEDSINWEILPNKIINCLNMKDEKYETDTMSLVDGCGCSTCKNLNRAYIFHLIKCNEMNAEIYLSVHNLYQYNEFFQLIYNSIQNNYFTIFAEWIIHTQTKEIIVEGELYTKLDK